MLGLPAKTEIKKVIPKNALYKKFMLTNAEQEKFDKDIKKITLVNEISPQTVSILSGQEVVGIFVLLVELKGEKFNESNIALISKLIKQKIFFVLNFEEKAQLAIYHSRLLHTAWAPIEELQVPLVGMNLDAVWESVIKQIGDIEIEGEKTLDEQIAINDKREKLKKEIAKLEALAWKEVQPKKKFELAQRILKLQGELEACGK